MRDEHRRRDQRSYSSRRSSTDSSEEGFNLNLRDLKVRQINTSFQLGAVETMSRRARKRREESELNPNFARIVIDDFGHVIFVVA